MRRIVLAVVVCLLLATLSPLAHTGESKLMLVRVRPASQAEARHLATSFDETHNHSPGEIELLLWPGDLARLVAGGYRYEVVEDDVVGRDAALASRPGRAVPLPGPDREDYRRLTDYVAEMQGLAKKNAIVDLIEFPRPSLEGRPIYGLEIAAGNPDDGRPKFYVDGIHHAREWPAAEYPMIFAHHLVERFGKDRRITSLLRRVSVLVVPIVNVDGFDYSRESPLQNPSLGAVNGFEGYWRKNRRSLSGITVPQVNKNPDAYGVDPNRNYAYLWGEDENGSSSLPLTATYRGSAPFSEPETQNVRELLSSEPVTAVITNHTYGNLVLRPWGHTRNDSPDEKILAPLGQRLSNVMGGYRNQKGIGLYATHGTTDDWAYAALSALGYTFEHGTAFHPPYQDGVGRQWAGVVEAFTIMAEAAGRDGWHSIISGRIVGADGRPANAKLTLTKTFETPLGDGNPSLQESIEEKIELTLRASGRFEWHVNPSTRPIPEIEKRESYTLTLEAGGKSRSFKIVVDRGEEIDLGTISV